MKKIAFYARKYKFSVICILLIWYLSVWFIPPHTPLDNVKFIDKWVHFVMYGGTFTVLWIEYTLKHKTADYEKLFFWAFLAPILMSGVLELLQEYCTGGCRNGDWLDFAANSFGVTLAAIIGLLMLRFSPKR
jgi:hypothetical protein